VGACSSYFEFGSAKGTTLRNCEAIPERLDQFSRHWLVAGVPSARRLLNYPRRFQNHFNDNDNR